MSGRTRIRACPERTCVGCRERAVKSDLLRVAVVGGACVPDLRGTLPGRGAYLHPAKACLDLAVRRRAFARAFRTRGPLGTAELSSWVERAGAGSGTMQEQDVGEPPGTPARPRYLASRK